MIKYIFTKYCYFTQASRHSFLWLNIKNNQQGLVLAPTLAKNLGLFNSTSNMPWWYKHLFRYLFPIFALTWFSHTGQRNQIWIFKLEVLGNYFGYKTWGDSEKKKDDFNPGGWILESRLIRYANRKIKNNFFDRNKL